MERDKSDSVLQGKSYIKVPIMGMVNLQLVNGDPSSEFTTSFHSAFSKGKAPFYVEDGDIWCHLEATSLGSKDEARVVLFKRSS